MFFSPRSRRLRLGFVLSVVTALACQRTSTEQPSNAKPSAKGASKTSETKIAGNAGGVSISAKKAIYLWREQANDLQLVFGDVDDLCVTLQAAALPKSSTIVMVTIKHEGNGPFTAGAYPIRTGEAKPQDTKRALALQLDATCKPIAQAKAKGGAVQLSTGEVKIDGIAEGSVAFEFADGEKVEGPFSATFCAQPDEEPHGCR